MGERVVTHKEFQLACGRSLSIQEGYLVWEFGFYPVQLSDGYWVANATVKTPEGPLTEFVKEHELSRWRPLNLEAYRSSKNGGYKWTKNLMSI